MLGSPIWTLNIGAENNSIALLFEVVAVVAMALAFEIPLRLTPLAAGSISLIAGVLAGAFLGLYIAKRVVERGAHRR
jgi:hypothetical protein